MSTTDETPPPKRRRPTVADVEGLETERDAARNDAARVRQQLQHAQANLDVAIAERDAERDRWATIDPQAKAIAAMVPVLDELAVATRCGRWDDPSIDAEVAEAVGAVLAYVASRYGVGMFEIGSDR